MSTVENYDGLCGIIHLSASSDKQVRCSYELGHHGQHSWANKSVGFHIFGGCINPHYHEGKFIESVLASLKK
jgi:hypothetical protein